MFGVRHCNDQRRWDGELSKALRQLAFRCPVGLWEFLEVAAKTRLGSCTAAWFFCGVNLLSERRCTLKSIRAAASSPPPPPPLPRVSFLFQLGNWIVLECTVPLFCATWMGSLVFHTKVSFRVWGQATKTALSGGLGPINIFVHKEIWQLNRLQGDLHCRCMPSQGTAALELKKQKRGGESFPN